MARITVEDCLEKVDSQYDLVLLAKERTSQLNAGDETLVPKDRDKNTVIALREIGEGKVSIKTLEDSAINKLRKQQEETSELEDLPNEHGDDFHTTYKGEISKSGTAILPSKIIRRIPEKANFNIKTTDEKNIKATDEKNDDESKKQVEPETSSTETKIEE